MQPPPPVHPAVQELTRVRQIHAQLLLRLRQLPAEIEAASSGLQVVRGPVKG